MFKSFFTYKSDIEPSNCLYYNDGDNKKDDKIHSPILSKGDGEYYKSLSIARLRARTGEDLEFITSLVS